jgi:hypothetical protein
MHPALKWGVKAKAEPHQQTSSKVRWQTPFKLPTGNIQYQVATI